MVGEIPTPAALAFVAPLEREFGGDRPLLHARRERREALDAGELPRFADETRSVREGEWTVPPPAAELADRRVELTRPSTAR